MRSFQHRAVVLQITGVELGEFDQPVEIIEPDASVAKCRQAILAQYTQDTVNVNRTQSERVGEMILRQRTGIAGRVTQADEFQPRLLDRSPGDGAKGGTAAGRQYPARGSR